MTPDPDSVRSVGKPSSGPALLIFSEKAAAAVEECIERQLKSLEKTSRFIARNKHEDTVSASHVWLAAEILGFKSNRKSKWAREVGALAIGAGISNLAAVLIASSYTFFSSILICVPLFGGFALYLYGLAVG
jgi:histone H3/H4